MAKRTNLATCFVAPLLKLNEAVLYRILAQIIREQRPLIQRLNQERLYRGENTDGTYIDPPYARSTVAIKREKGQQADWVTLRDTGNFYKKIYTKVFAKAFEVDDRDSKTAELKEKYGEDILGLSEADKDELIEVITPIFIARIRAFIDK